MKLNSLQANHGKTLPTPHQKWLRRVANPARAPGRAPLSNEDKVYQSQAN